MIARAHDRIDAARGSLPSAAAHQLAAAQSAARGSPASTLPAPEVPPTATFAADTASWRVWMASCALHVAVFAGFAAFALFDRATTTPTVFSVSVVDAGALTSKGSSTASADSTARGPAPSTATAMNETPLTDPPTAETAGEPVRIDTGEAPAEQRTPPAADTAAPAIAERAIQDPFSESMADGGVAETAELVVEPAPPPKDPLPTVANPLRKPPAPTPPKPAPSENASAAPQPVGVQPGPRTRDVAHSTALPGAARGTVRNNDPTDRASTTGSTAAGGAASQSRASAGAGFTAARFEGPGLSNARPQYPKSARRRGQQGVVRLRVLVSAAGTCAGAHVEESSGHGVLDQAAVASVCDWKFVPARKNGNPVPSEVTVPVRFLLSGE